MSKRGDTKDKLLGELESIKALLHEDEWADIPLLNDIIEPGPGQAATSDHPDDSSLEELASAFLQESDDEQPADGLREDVAAPEARDESDGATQTDAGISADTPDTDLTDSPAATPNSATKRAADTDTNNDIAKAINALNMDLDLGEPHEESLPHAAAAADRDFDSNFDSDEQVAEPASGGTRLPPGVLPGQRGLFDQTPAEGGRSTRKASGENPFLPQHIRERLHINRSLVDELKSSAEANFAAPTGPISAARLQQLVDQVLAIHMPRIEAELRERLLQELQHTHSRDDKA